MQMDQGMKKSLPVVAELGGRSGIQTNHDWWVAGFILVRSY